MSERLCQREKGEFPWTVLKVEDDFGLRVCDLVSPPERFWADAQKMMPTVEANEDFAHLEVFPTPAQLLGELPAGDNWSAMTRRSLNRAFAWFVTAEDPQRRMEAREISTLAHQLSIVAHVLKEPGLQNVLIADEVGLGKTIEAGLLIKELLTARPGTRVLYLAPARLVRNVRKEFEKLDLRFRIWVSGGEQDARLTDDKVIASIHRAVHPNHFEAFVDQIWDVVIVDECHHLSDWGAGGGSPTRKYKLVDELREDMPNSGRLILMSGTPHQGHGYRFENLLNLLKRPEEEQQELRGRVIYRTKEDIVDWEGRPLFPGREVNPPIVLDLGAGYRSWLEDIYGFFVPGRHDEGSSIARRRASGWRASQAMQWAASSIQAGLGYLVRQGIRADWDSSHPGMSAAIKALRPYRGGDAAEAPADLFRRMKKEVERQSSNYDVDDIEEALEAVERWVPDTAILEELLMEGVRLLDECGDAKWDYIWRHILEGAGTDKVVLFAQPIETVTTLADFLRRKTGHQPALIIGAQSEDEREKEVESFWSPQGPQFLVSSRAGGEGINLQVARRLVHVDVPWNPMELEQRVGRVHRFLSRQTVLVDTVVVKDSREVDAYQIARTKLLDITKTMNLDDRFEQMFSRVMALVPPDDLQDVLAERALGPLTDEDQRRISDLVVSGFERWQSFHDQYAAQQKKIVQLEAGLSSWDDLASFARLHLHAKEAEGFETLSFEHVDGEVLEHTNAARVLEIGGELYACGDSSGMPVAGDNDQVAKPLGLNVPVIAEEIRKWALTSKKTGAAYLRWPADKELPLVELERPFGVLSAVRQSVRWIEGAWVEAGLDFYLRVVCKDGTQHELDGPIKADVLRTLVQSTIRKTPPDISDLNSVMREVESKMWGELCRPTDEEREVKVRHALTPLLAAIVE